MSACVVFVLLFADDMILFSNSPDELQTLLNRLHSYSSHWGLKVNTAKTKVCVFQKQHQNIVKVWKYNNEELEVVDSFCYLGQNCTIMVILQKQQITYWLYFKGYLLTIKRN